MASNEVLKQMDNIIGQVEAGKLMDDKKQLYRQLVDVAASAALLGAAVLEQIESSGNALQPG